MRDLRANIFGRAKRLPVHMCNYCTLGMQLYITATENLLALSTLMHGHPQYGIAHACSKWQILCPRMCGTDSNGYFNIRSWLSLTSDMGALAKHLEPICCTLATGSHQQQLAGVA